MDQVARQGDGHPRGGVTFDAAHVFGGCMRCLSPLLFGLFVLIPGATALAEDGETQDTASTSSEESEAETETEEAPDEAVPDEAVPDDPRVEQLQGEVEALTLRLERLETPPPKRDVARLKFDVGGYVQSDVRFRVQEKSIGSWFDRHTLPVGFVRNENIFKFRGKAAIKNFRAVVDMDFVLTGFPETMTGLADLTSYSNMQPFHIELHSAYVAATDFILPGLDLRVGQQLVQWGVGDQFNPTNNLNANDVEDPLLFGTQQGNLMVRLDYTIADTWTISGVVVPVFKGALLPASSQLGLAATDRLPYVDDGLRWAIHSQTELGLQTGYGTIVKNVVPELPEPSIDNVQFAFRVGGTLGMQDIALSYYRGFSDFPQAYSTTNQLVDNPMCENDPAPPAVREGEPGENEQCISGRIEASNTLRYPRVHVVGLNLSGEIPVIGLGYRLEVGIYLPEGQSATIYDPVLPPFRSGLEYDYDRDGEPGGASPEVVSPKAFAKWTLGLDYSIGPHIMLNAQWVHGMVDEFGYGDFIRPGGWSVRQASVDYDQEVPTTLFECSEITAETKGAGAQCAREILRPKLADYLVFGIDVNFARSRGLFRLFTLWDLSGYTVQYWDIAAGERVSEHWSPFSKEGLSAVIYPEVRYKFGHGFEAHVGAVLNLGRDYTKFGDPAAGGSLVFTRAKFSF
jgi:hypothetical protein